MVNIIPYSAIDFQGEPVVIDINQNDPALDDVTHSDGKKELRLDRNGNPYAADKALLDEQSSTHNQVQEAMDRR